MHTGATALMIMALAAGAASAPGHAKAPAHTKAPAHANASAPKRGGLVSAPACEAERPLKIPLVKITLRPMDRRCDFATSVNGRAASVAGSPPCACDWVEDGALVCVVNGPAQLHVTMNDQRSQWAVKSGQVGLMRIRGDKAGCRVRPAGGATADGGALLKQTAWSTLPLEPVGRR